ncbi:TPA: hypothetical protein ACU9T0_006398 [Burkholderia cenocepacia]|uniref:hypothetical protein n=1 Tax=Burkholderia sp. TaxID=36773 RepID=UPI00258F67F4|nr:hypothetical protein [Burkholderia sp.]MCL4631381.1 hypothetical protein [Burkholderia sp.]
MNIYDRIVPNQAYVTLWSLAIGVALAVLMEAVSRHVISRRPPRAGRIVMNEPQYFVRRDLLGAFVVLLNACTTQPGATYTVRAIKAPDQVAPVFRVTGAQPISGRESRCRFAG